MYFRQEIGKWGENLACQYLEKRNYEVIEKNFRCHYGEIDIIAKDIRKKEFVFFEVKTRSNLKYGNPAEAVTKQKQRHIKKAVDYFIYKSHLESQKIRVDVIEVFIKKEKAKVHHIKQIF